MAIQDILELYRQQMGLGSGVPLAQSPAPTPSTGPTVQQVLEEIKELLKKRPEQEAPRKVKKSEIALSGIGDALTAAASVLGRGNFQTHGLERLDAREALRQQILNQQSQQGFQDELTGLQLELGAAENEEGQRRSIAAEDRRTQAQIDAENRREAIRVKEFERDKISRIRQLTAEADLPSGSFDLSTPEGQYEAERRARRVIRQREIDNAADTLDARQEKALAEANTVANLLLNGSEEANIPDAASRLQAGESVEDILAQFESELRMVPGSRGMVRQLAMELLRGDLLELQREVQVQQRVSEGRSSLEQDLAEFQQFEEEDRARKRRIDKAKASSGRGASARGAGFQG